MPLRGTISLVLLLAACAHAPARTDNSRPQSETRATPTPAPTGAVTNAAPPSVTAPVPETTAPATPQLVATAQASATPSSRPVAGKAATLPTSAEPRVEFARDIQPILESHCQPCHFPGGRMYERRPFDRASTIRDLGTKLFTRIKDENEQAVIRRFLAQAE